MKTDTVAQSLWMVLAGLSFALMAQCIKLALASMGVFELSLYRCLGGIVLLGAWLKLRGRPLAVRHWPLHFWRAAWGTVAILLFYYAIGGLTPSLAYAFNYLAPLVFIVLAAVALREKLRPSILLALGLSFGGVLLLLRPDFSNAELLAAGAGLVSGCCAAMAFLMIRKLGQAGEGGMRTVFFFNVHGLAFAAAGLLVIGEVDGIDAASALPVAGMVLAATAGQLFLTQALHRGRTGTTAAFSYSGVAFSVLIDAFILDAGFRLIDYLGFALIVGGGVASALLVRRET
ncbi:MAG: DMT family transporter, partial [Betaproteobacteria bacterium AqS2]|nr:DMT family transporter [Betaproteobacteria bacterium AqS2]